MKEHLKNIIYVTLVCFLAACDNNRQSELTKSEIAKDTATIMAGKDWLEKSIESFFNNDENFLKGFSYLCTGQYAEFKKDATNIVYDGGMTEAEFKSKWGRRYSKYAGIGEGFMIAGTDFGKIEVTKCEFKNATEMKNFLYDVVIIDKTFNSKFTRQVILVKNGDAFLIDNVLEISNEFQDQKYN